MKKETFEGHMYIFRQRTSVGSYVSIDFTKGRKKCEARANVATFHVGSPEEARDARYVRKGSRT